MIENESVIEKYISYVSEVMQKYSKSANLIYENEVNPQDLNLALASYLEINMALIAEYQRKKIQFFALQNDFDKWYDSKFMELKKKILNETEKNIKTSVKEMDIQLRAENSIEYYNWQEKLKVAEYEEAFILRLIEQYKKFDTILVCLAQNMRSEIRSLSLPDRMSKDPENKLQRVRKRFPMSDE